MRRMIIVLILSALFLVGILVGAQKTETVNGVRIIHNKKGGQEKNEINNAVTVIKNPLKPLFNEDILELKEEIIIQNSDFARPAGLALDENNNIYVLDTKESNVKVFDENGRFLRIIGRKGHGPGELDGPANISIFGRNEIAILDSGNRRLIFFSLDGEYKRSLSTARLSIGDLKIDSQGNIFCMVMTFRDGRRRHELQKFDSNMNYITTLDYVEVPIDKSISLFVPGPSFVISKEDRIVYGSPENEYEVKLFNNEGKLIRIIRKDYVPIKIPQEEIDYVTRKVPPGIKAFIPEYYSPYFQINEDDEGRIIVFASYQLKRKIYSIDIFNVEGKYFTTKKIKGNLRVDCCIWRKNKLYTIEEDEESGLPEVKIYRVVWKLAS
jgi:hypothetical protein